MSKYSPDENTNEGPTSSISVDDVLELECGDAIGVRAMQEDFEHFVIGRVSSEPLSRTELSEKLNEHDTASIIAIDANRWWCLNEDGITESTSRIENRPQYQPAIGEPLKDAPSCSLACWPDGTVFLIIPMPVYGSSRIKYYAPENYGTVVALNSGVLVDAESLLPDGYDSLP